MLFRSQYQKKEVYGAQREGNTNFNSNTGQGNYLMQSQDGLANSGKSGQSSRASQTDTSLGQNLGANGPVQMIGTVPLNLNQIQHDHQAQTVDDNQEQVSGGQMLGQINTTQLQQAIGMTSQFLPMQQNNMGRSTGYAQTNLGNTDRKSVV